MFRQIITNDGWMVNTMLLYLLYRLKNSIYLIISRSVFIQEYRQANPSEIIVATLCKRKSKSKKDKLTSDKELFLMLLAKEILKSKKQNGQDTQYFR